MTINTPKYEHILSTLHLLLLWRGHTVWLRVAIVLYNASYLFVGCYCDDVRCVLICLTQWYQPCYTNIYM
jgi:hypothetical protein